MPARIAALVLSLFALTAAPAQAANVTVDVITPPQNPKWPGDPPYSLVRYDALPGETNAVTVSDGPNGEIVVRDESAPLVAHSGCAAGEAGTVVCTVARTGYPVFTGVQVRAGDGDDRVLAATPATVYGEAGADVLEATAKATLIGADGDDTLTGSPFADTLSGGAGADRLAGGAGPDELTGDGSISYGTPDIVGDDVLDGGEGIDLLAMWRRRDVTVDLAGGTAGGPGERDTVGGFERVMTGEGEDRVIGTDGPEQIDTGPGDDEADGRGGDDVIDGGAGTNLLDGGAGDDYLRFSARSCGPGADILEGMTVPAAPADCESIGFEAFNVAAGMTVDRRPVRFGRRGVGFRVACPKSQSLATHCAVRLSVRTRRGTVLARSTRWLRVAQGSSGIARLRVTPSGRRILRSRRVQLRVLDSAGRFGWNATYESDT